MKKPTKGPVASTYNFPDSRLQRAFPEDPPLYLLPRLGRRRVKFVFRGVDGYDHAYAGSIDVDDISIMQDAGCSEVFGQLCIIVTKSGQSRTIQGDIYEVEEKLFGEISQCMYRPG